MNTDTLSKNIAISTLLLSAHSFAETPDKKPENEHDKDISISPSLVLSTGKECNSFDARVENCVTEKYTLDLKAETNNLFLKIRASETDQTFIYKEKESLKDLMVGIKTDNTRLSVGQMELRHPIIRHFENEPEINPISWDNPLHDQTISNRLGALLETDHTLNDTWTIKTKISVTRPKHILSGHHTLPNDIYGNDNIRTLSKYNDLDLSTFKIYEDSVKSYHANIKDQFDTIRSNVSEMIDNQDFSQINTLPSDLHALSQNQFPQPPSLSPQAVDFAILSSWLSLNYGNGNEKIENVIADSNLDETIQDVLHNISNAQNQLNEFSPQDIVSELEEYLSPEEIEDIKEVIESAVSSVSSAISDAEQDIKSFSTDEIIDKIRDEINQRVASDPQKYNALLRKQIEQLQNLNRAYQDQATDPSLDAEFALVRQSPGTRWEMGMHAQKIPGGQHLEDQERYGIYSILDRRLSEKFYQKSVVSLDYFKNNYGVEDFEDVSGYLYNRLSYTPNRNITLYAAHGFSATLLNSANQSFEVGGVYCKENPANTRFCLQAAYEKNEYIDGYEERDLGFQPEDGEGFKLRATIEFN